MVKLWALFVLEQQLATLPPNRLVTGQAISDLRRMCVTWSIGSVQYSTRPSLLTTTTALHRKNYKGSFQDILVIICEVIAVNLLLENLCVYLQWQGHLTFTSLVWLVSGFAPATIYVQRHADCCSLVGASIGIRIGQESWATIQDLVRFWESL